MNLKPVTKIPGRKPINNNILDALTEFMKMDSQIAEIDPIKEGYKHVNSLQSTLIKSLKNSEYKGMIKIMQRNGMVYLMKISPLEENI